MKTTTNKLASMILKMFEGDVGWAYKYSLALLSADIAYAPIVTILKDQLPLDFFDEKKEEVSIVQNEVKLEEIETISEPPTSANPALYNEGWFKFSPPVSEPGACSMEDPDMQLPDPFDPQ
jgi:hypothetical protein